MTHSQFRITDEDRNSPEYQEAKRAYELAELVRHRRLELRLSQADLAARAGMTQPQLSRLEAGGVSPTFKLLDRLARALETELIVSFKAIG
ncbi:hypothetical protein Psi02_53420 [Planotetraspora silvatica]|uniref:HTH cro/C1-type domain-containing protein n=1 Tax=Planotetraspora silvatica TaxID=234614 RepID=A0A8J3XTY6_9ACTN|nr:helix-turn-helix transcriptional regulator [Planotetraspora silvatica]GII48918.1 hypothetical protein Psi02_53420 [Planotetraspora silvatica]